MKFNYNIIILLSEKCCFTRTDAFARLGCFWILFRRPVSNRIPSEICPTQVFGANFFLQLRYISSQDAFNVGPADSNGTEEIQGSNPLRIGETPTQVRPHAFWLVKWQIKIAESPAGMIVQFATFCQKELSTNVYFNGNNLWPARDKF